MASPRRETSIAGVLGATQVDDGPRGLTGSVNSDSQAIPYGNATKKKAGMKRRTAPKEPAAEARAATPSTSQDEESYVSDDSQL